MLIGSRITSLIWDLHLDNLHTKIEWFLCTIFRGLVFTYLRSVILVLLSGKFHSIVFRGFFLNDDWPWDSLVWLYNLYKDSIYVQWKLFEKKNSLWSKYFMPVLLNALFLVSILHCTLHELYGIYMTNYSLQINAVGTADEIFEQVRPVFEACEVYIYLLFL